MRWLTTPIRLLWDLARRSWVSLDPGLRPTAQTLVLAWKDTPLAAKDTWRRIAVGASTPSSSRAS